MYLLLIIAVLILLLVCQNQYVENFQGNDCPKQINITNSADGRYKVTTISEHGQGTSHYRTHTAAMNVVNMIKSHVPECDIPVNDQSTKQSSLESKPKKCPTGIKITEKDGKYYLTVIFDKNRKTAEFENHQGAKIAARMLKVEFPDCNIPLKDKSTNKDVPLKCPFKDVILSESNGKYKMQANEIATGKALVQMFDTYDEAIRDYKRGLAVYPDCTMIDRTANKLQESVRQANDKLQQLDQKLERNQELDQQEHEDIREIADDVPKESKKLKKLDDTNKRQLKSLLEQIQEIERDLRETREIERKYPKNPKLGILKREINSNRRELERQGRKLDKIEETVEDTKYCMENSKTLLKNIVSKLNRLDGTNDKRNRRTAKKINRKLAKCPPCPLYSETTPVDVAEVKRQGVGTIAPLAPYLEYLVPKNPK